MNFSTYIFTLVFLLSTKERRSLAGKVFYPKDVLFLIDGSGSVKPRNFDKLRVILKNMIDGMNISPGLRDGTHVALIQFSSRERTKVEFNLDTYDNKEDMKAAIDDMVYQRRYTYTGYAMQMAEREVFNGGGGDRSNAKNIIVLFTDGHAADPHIAEEAAESMKSRGDHVMTVGFGRQRSIDRFKPELEKMSTDKEKDVFLKGFDDVQNIQKRLEDVAIPESNLPPLNLCSKSTCLNNGRCENRPGSFICYCTGEWEGERCERKKGPCSDSPCQNDGICVAHGDRYKCICGDEFYGDLCEKERVVCTTKNADILIIMDDSRSIKSQDYISMKDFVIKLVSRFNISEDQSHVALIQFSDLGGTGVKFYLNSHYTKDSVISRVKALKQSDGGQTLTNIALQLARQAIFDGKRGDRPNVRDVIVLLTDGQSHNDAAAKEEARLLRNDDVSVISIGVGQGEKVDDFYNFLKDLSSGSDYVFKVSFANLDTILDGVTKAACENLQDS